MNHHAQSHVPIDRSYNPVAMRRGRQLLWVVFGSSLTALIVTAVSIGEFSVGIVVSIVVWLVLGYCSFRGQQWARWIAVVILAAIGAFLVLVETGVYLVPGVRPDLGSILVLVGGVALFVDALILAFSESVGDFMAWRTGVPLVENWETAAVAVGHTEQARSIDRLELLEASRKRTIMSRRARRATVAVSVFACTIIFGGLSWLLIDSFLAYRQFQEEQQTEVQEAREQISQASLLQFPLIIEGYLKAGISIFLLIIVFIVAMTLLPMVLLATYLALFFFPFILTLPVILPFARRWHDPIRFLILRPFNKDRITAELTRFLREQFSPFGHCYTLSDRKVRVPLLVRIPLVLGQLAFFNFRLRKIRRPQHIENLAQAMRKRVRRNLNWCFSRTKLFPVTCCDPGWQACVARLVQEVDIVVVDLSSMTANIAWELELLRDSGTLSKAVFLSQEAQSIQVKEHVSRILGESSTLPLLLYGPENPSNSDVVAGSIIEILSSSEQRLRFTDRRDHQSPSVQTA